MGRPVGARNREYEHKRRTLARDLAGALQRDDGSPAALADLAATAGVSTTTLRHYFGDRDGVVQAVLETVRDDSAAYLRAGTTAAGRPPEQTLPELLLGTVLAWQHHGLDRALTGALAVGLGSATRGPHVVAGLLEPLLHAVERLLVEHAHAGELPALSAEQGREAALALVAPLLLALLHQDSLHGRAVRPLDVEALARRHAALVLAGLRADARPT